MLELRNWSYIDNSVSVDDPHNSWLRMSCYAALETCPFAFFHSAWVRSADKHRRATSFDIIRWLFRNTVKNILK